MDSQALVRNDATMTTNVSHSDARAFAVDVVHQLRAAGHEAVWAGGCVRDALLDITPKDYDVATSARPEQVVELFGKRRTIGVGASFGVIMLLGHKRSQLQVEVATFRTDGTYSDGRRPDSVEYCSAEEDALRRDFTINGMFFDPVEERVIDYVEGRKDLQRRLIRAIRDPHERISEDKLRMLRAVRFAARFDFRLEEKTAAAIRTHVADLHQVSVERISQELRHMFSHPRKRMALNLLSESSLFPVVFPQVSVEAFDATCRVVEHLALGTFEQVMSLLLREHLCVSESGFRRRAAEISKMCRNLKLSNDETDAIGWLSDGSESCHDLNSMPLHIMKPLFADERHELLVDILRAEATAEMRSATDLQFLDEWLESTSPEERNPAAFVDGADLKALQIEPGPQFTSILSQIRKEQLDEQITTREQALERASILNQQS